MKNLTSYITEKFRITNKNISKRKVKRVWKREQLEEAICDSIENRTSDEVDLNNIVISGVENLSRLFAEIMDSYGCDLKGITSLTMDAWDVSGVENMAGLFSRLPNLKNLDIKNWNPKAVTDMSGMFWGLSLKKLDLSNWNVTSVENLTEMITNLSELEELNLSNWNLVKATKFSKMFANNPKLKKINLSNWKVSAATDLSEMFYGCESLEKLDLSGWDVSNVNDMTDMFRFCKNLKEVKCDNWVVKDSCLTSNMFKETSLVKEPDWFIKRQEDNKKVTEIDIDAVEDFAGMSIDKIDSIKTVKRNNQYNLWFQFYSILIKNGPMSKKQILGLLNLKPTSYSTLFSQLSWQNIIVPKGGKLHPIKPKEWNK